LIKRKPGFSGKIFWSLEIPFKTGFTVVETLKQDQPGEIFLTGCEVLQRANRSTTAVVFEISMNALWSNRIQRNNVLLVINTAPYIKKAAKGLQMLYPNMIHITRLAHALHRVAEFFRM
jgi:hypothetical protein